MGLREVVGPSVALAVALGLLAVALAYAKLLVVALSVACVAVQG